MAKIIEIIIENSKVLRKIFFLFLLTLVVYDFHAERKEIFFWGDNIICFWAVFGFLGTNVIVSLTRTLKGIFSKKKGEAND